MKKMIVLLGMIFVVVMMIGVARGEDDYSKGVVIIAAADNVTVEELNNLVSLYNLTWEEGSPITTYGPLRGYVIVLEGEEQSWIEIFENESIIRYASLSPVAELATDCKNLYWFDNDNKNCSQKQFCGTYMYLSLQTFASKTQCEKALNITPECVTDDDCPQLDCIGEEDCIGIEVKCIYGKCKEQKESKNCQNNSNEENNKCYKTLSNGRKAEIKIMPETASATAIARLGELGFTIELKEVGKDKIVYELTGNKQGKFLGIFKIIARVQAQVDAETGEIIKVKKPWWAFLASGI